MSEKEWVLAATDTHAARQLGNEVGISRVTAQLMINRGLKSPDDARRFLRPDLQHLHDPFTFEDMRKAVDRVHAALKSNERIAVFGDYDVDGISSTCLLTKYFQLHAREIDWVIPHRTKDGYGLTISAIDKLHERGATVLITLDCGMTNLKEVAHARELGMDVIVLDHHEETHSLPAAYAIINPKRSTTAYPFRGLCSTGLAFKFAWALSDDLPTSWKRADPYKHFLIDAFSLVTLATLADVVPLVDENRIFVHYGLDALRACPSKGIRKLLLKAGIRERAIEPWDIGFKLAPRLNALGRMGDAADCLKLLLSNDEAEIDRILDVAEKANRERQRTEGKITDEAIEEVARCFHPERDIVIVVEDASWHRGVVGIVAARLVDRFHRPAIVLATQDGRSKGSGRSAGGLNLAAALEIVKPKMPGLVAGGHAQAVGVDVAKPDMQRFRELINEAAREQLGTTSWRERLAIDDEVSLTHLTVPLCRELKMMSPHGAGNPEPVLAVRRVKLAGEPRIMKEKHLAFIVEDGGESRRVVAFNQSELASRVSKASSFDLAFVPQINTYAGEEVELRMKDIRFVS